MSTTLFAPHIGPNVIPNTPLLTQLLRHAQHRGRLAVRDANISPPLERTYADLLVDAIALREVLEEKLPATANEKLQRQSSRNESVAVQRVDHGVVDEDTVFIGVLAVGGYEYVVAIVAVWMLGACVVPMSKFDFFLSFPFSSNTHPD